MNTQNIIALLLQICAIFGNKCRPRYAPTSWAKGSVESRNTHLGRFIPFGQNNIPWLDRVEIYTFAHNTQTIADSHFSPYEKVFKKFSFRNYLR